MPHTSQRLFEQFMASLPGLAWIKDLEGRYVFVNETAARAFHHKVEQILGMTDEVLFPAGTAAGFRENDRKALDSGIAVQTIETLRHADGVVHHSLVSKFPIFGEDGKVAGVAGMAFDITDRVRAEEALRESDRRKDEFLATLAHELRNPLAPIRNAVQIMRMPAASEGDVGRARDLIDRQVLLMVRLIDDLLDVSRIARNKLALRKAPAELTSVIQGAVETSRPAIDSARHVLTVTLPQEPVRLEADAARLGQVFSNLLNNAARYTEAGGHIWLTAERKGSEVEVSVRDTGIGIHPEHLGSLFVMFSQVTSSLAHSQGGLGIGLSLVRGLVELHGGSVEAKSDGPGKGSEFVVRLPVGEPAPAEARVADAPPAAPHLTRRVLIVDDNEANAESLAMMLRTAGHDVRIALDGLEGVQSAAVFHPHVVLLDIGMPRMNGYEVARHIRMQPWGRDMKLVAMTGWGQEGDRRRSQDAGFDTHLVKPVDPEVVAALLDQRGQGSPV